MARAFSISPTSSASAFRALGPRIFRSAIRVQASQIETRSACARPSSFSTVAGPIPRGGTFTIRLKLCASSGLATSRR